MDHCMMFLIALALSALFVEPREGGTFVELILFFALWRT